MQLGPALARLRTWVRQAEAHEGLRVALTGKERVEQLRLRREVRMEVEVSSAWRRIFAREAYRHNCSPA
jgi:hypothetical protein